MTVISLTIRAILSRTRILANKTSQSKLLVSVFRIFEPTVRGKKSTYAYYKIIFIIYSYIKSIKSMIHIVNTYFICGHILSDV